MNSRSIHVKVNSGATSPVLSVTSESSVINVYGKRGIVMSMIAPACAALANDAWPLALRSLNCVRAYLALWLKACAVENRRPTWARSA